jgi:tRNA1(Val) A37 N6-methylase TrmN6
VIEAVRVYSCINLITRKSESASAHFPYYIKNFCMNDMFLISITGFSPYDDLYCNPPYTKLAEYQTDSKVNKIAVGPEFCLTIDDTQKL